MKLYGVWQVTGLPNGEQYKWEPDEVLPDEERTILAEAGLDAYEDWIRALDRREATAVQTLVWFLRRQNGGKQDVGRANVVLPHRKVQLELIEEPPPVDGRPESPADSSESSATSAADTSSPSSIDTQSSPPTGDS